MSSRSDAPLPTEAAEAARSTSGTIPIIIARVTDPVGTALVASLARPGGNITGLSAMTGELSAKRLQLLKEALPQARRVAVIWNSDNPGPASVVRELEQAAPHFGHSLQALPARSGSDLPGAFEAITKGRVDVVFALDDPFITSHKQQILDWATKNRLPVISQYREFTEAGALISYGPSIRDMYRRAAYFVDKILKGAKPGELPVEQPAQLELAINLKAANVLGITVPQAFLGQVEMPSGNGQLNSLQKHLLYHSLKAETRVLDGLREPERHSTARTVTGDFLVMSFLPSQKGRLSRCLSSTSMRRGR